MNNLKSISPTKQGYLKAERITKKHATTFYLASCFLPREKRLSSFAVYALCRIADDNVDNQSISNAVSDNLRKIMHNIESAYNNSILTEPLLLAFKETIERYQIPKQYFDDLFEGIQMDLTINRYGTFDELYLYCYRVAGVVGLIMLKIFGCEESFAQKHAVDLGIALQLTNILRDIKEDYSRGRIYIPQEDMQRFRISEQYIKDQRLDENFVELVKYYIDLARQYYNNAGRGIKAISDWRCRLVVFAIKDLYSSILKAIEQNNYNVYSRRARINNAGKILLTAKILLKGQYL